MFRQTRTPMRCRKYEARFEDYLSGAPDTELEKHMGQCVHCHAAFEDARLAGAWLREAWEPTLEPRPAFLTGVMASIREEKLRVESPPAFWGLLEFLASRVSMTAAIVLLLLSGYLVGFAPRRATVPAAPTELSVADFPQPPADPVSTEEVLQSLAERSYGH